MSEDASPTRAATYRRISDADSAKTGYGLDSQAHQIAEYAAAHGYVLAEDYVDAGIAGDREDRPALLRLLAEVDQFEVVIVWDVSRLSRDLLLLGKITQALTAADVRIESVTNRIDLETPEGELQFNIGGSVAQYERKKIGQRVKAAAATRARSGKHHGRPPYGYESRDGQLQPLPHQAAIVRRIFDAFLTGTSQRQITRDLIAEGVAAPRTNWHQGTVSQILRNVTYSGHVRFNDEVRDGQHPPIIPADRFDQAQRLLDASARTKGWRGKQPTMHLFVKGHLKCGECGESMVPRSGRGDGADTYRCYSRLRLGPDACDQKPVKRKIIDRAVLRHFEHAALDVAATRAQLSEAIDRQLAEVRALRERAKREAHRAADRLARVKRDYQDGNLDADDWREQRAELAAEQAAADAEAARLAEHAAAIEDGGTLNDVETATVQRLADLRAAVVGEVRDAEDVAATRSVLVKMFDHFRLHAVGTVDLDALAEADPFIDALAAGDYLLVVEPRPESVAGLDEEWRPVLHREPIPMRDNSDGNGLTT